MSAAKCPSTAESQWATRGSTFPMPFDRVQQVNSLLQDSLRRRNSTPYFELLAPRREHGHRISILRAGTLSTHVGTSRSLRGRFSAFVHLSLLTDLTLLILYPMLALTELRRFSRPGTIPELRSVRPEEDALQGIHLASFPLNMGCMRHGDHRTWCLRMVCLGLAPQQSDRPRPARPDRRRFHAARTRVPSRRRWPSFSSRRGS